MTFFKGGWGSLLLAQESGTPHFISGDGFFLKNIMQTIYSGDSSPS